MFKSQHTKMIDFLGRVDQLKDTPRFTRSLKKGSHDSSADHSWRLSLMAFLVADNLNLKINKEKSMKLAIVHDLAEAVTGDIDAMDVITGKVSKKEKDKHELQAIKKLTKGMPFKDKIEKLWQEYLDQKTNEAKYVKALDKIEGYLSILQQGHESYKHKQFHHTYGDEAVANFPDIEEFYVSVKKKLKKELAKGKIEWVE